MSRTFFQKARYLVLGLLLSALTACSHQPLVLDTDGQDVLPRQQELETVPFFSQQAHQCAPAALATILNHLDIALTPEQISPYVFLPARKGSIAPEVIAFARAQGLLAYPLQNGLHDLLREIAAGNPVLVLQNLSFDWLPQWHYAVVMGYDLDKGQIILRSAKEKRWITSFTAFDNTWRRSGRWAYVIVQPDRLPATAAPLPLIQAAHDLETIGRLEAAAKIYQSAYQVWPREKLVLLARGNFSYGLKHYRDALEMFQRLTVLYPDDADGWNNLAYSLMQLGCRHAAIDAIDRALQLVPEDENLRSTRQEISKSSHSASDSNSCDLKEIR